MALRSQFVGSVNGNPALSGKPILKLAQIRVGSYRPAMQAHTRPGRRWRRFTRKYGSVFGLAFAMLFILAFVVGLMFVLTDMSCRARY